MREHPNWIRIPATWVPRAARAGEAGKQWDVSLRIPNDFEATSIQPVVAAQPASEGEQEQVPAAPPEARMRTGGVPPPVSGHDAATEAVTAYLSTTEVFANPGRAAGVL